MASFEPLTAAETRRRLKEGHVIPAHPLALTEDRELDERRQRALTRYYLDAGAGGLAVGVHTTQFEIHEESVGLYEPVLEYAADTAASHVADTDRDRPIMVAGLVGDTEEACEEARLARDLGYDCGLLSLAAFPDASTDELVDHVEAVAEEMPVFGFYLQEDVGGRHLSLEFWRRFAAIENVVGVKVAPFDRYQTHDVVRAVAESGRADEIALYTGNDDSIVNDLVTEFPYDGGIRFDGGLLGQWAVWTKTAVELLERIETAREDGDSIPDDVLALGSKLVDANAAIFDPHNDYAGCISGIHEILRRQGLLEGRWCLSDEERLSPGQMDELDRVCAAYPELTDDDFVEAHRDEWLE
jgi:dihydrodipicolinate synthase/N-acetylneuraminate lyase